MTKDQVKAVLECVPSWSWWEIALEIEAELASTEYQATPGELAAIDERLSGDAASEEEVDAALALLRKG